MLTLKKTSIIFAIVSCFFMLCAFLIPIIYIMSDNPPFTDKHFYLCLFLGVMLFGFSAHFDIKTWEVYSGEGAIRKRSQLRSMKLVIFLSFLLILMTIFGL